MSRPPARATALLLSLALVASACSTSGDSAESTTTTAAAEPATTTTLNLTACDADARVGFQAAEVAMDRITDEPLHEVVDGGWNALLADDTDYAAARAAIDTLERRCATADMLSVRVVDLADEILPTDVNDAVIWVEAMGSTTVIAGQVPPDEASRYVDPAGGETGPWPDPIGLDTIDACSMVVDATLAQIDGYLGVWGGQDPIDTAFNLPEIDLAEQIQASRLRAAELECDLPAFGADVFLALTTVPTESFVSRGLRLTYAEWVLQTMVVPTAEPDDEVLAQPIGRVDGTLAGIAVQNRADVAGTGISVTVDGATIAEPFSLDAAAARWIPHDAETVSSVAVDWDR